MLSGRVWRTEDFDWKRSLQYLSRSESVVNVISTQRDGDCLIMHGPGLNCFA